MQKYLPILERCPLFENISSSEMTAMLSCLGARTVECSKDEALFMEGDPARQVGVVLSGSVQIVRDSFYGNRSIVATFGAAQLFGETFACANVDRLPVSAIAAEKSAIMLIDCRRITTACSSACAFHSRMILNLLKVVASKNLLLNQKIEIISKRTTREKLMAYLSGQAKRSGSSEFTIPYDRQGLADYLGVERSALSTEIGKLRGEGVLESERSCFRLLRPAEHP